MYTLVLLRHGQSSWNLENRFTGWTDVDLTEQGIAEAKQAGQLIKEAGYSFDMAYTSLLKRAIRTLWLTLDELDQMWVPVVRDWRLNERHYGNLQGLNKAEMAAKFGEEQVHIWRRSYDVPPPALEPNDPRSPVNDPRYAFLSPEKIPLTECLKDTVERFVPLWENEIAPRIKKGKKILIVAHGNSLRALIKYLEHTSEEEIVSLNIPTGVPLVYQLDKDLKPIRSEYLGDPEQIQAAIASVAAQGKNK